MTDRLRWVLSWVVALVAFGGTLALVSKVHHRAHQVTQGVPTLKPKQSSQRLTPLVDPWGKGRRVTVAGRTLEARLLVVSVDGSEPSLAAIRQALDYLGTPYHVHVAKTSPGALTPALLAEGSRGHFQGVILATSNLSFFDGTGWRSALTQAEWQTLADYELNFSVRQVTWYTYPVEALGFALPVTEAPGNVPPSLRITAAGRQAFPYLSGKPLPIRHAYTYLARAAPGAVPLFQDEEGHALVVTATLPDGRENLALTFDQDAYLMHSVALSYGVVNWVTRGLFLGYRRVYASAQVDDVFLENDLWENPSLGYRMTGADLKATVQWQLETQSRLLSPSFRLDMAFNGLGTEQDEDVEDTLTPAARSYGAQFKWISHTYNHPYLDEMDYASVREELTKNIQVAGSLGLKDFCPKNLVTPNITGLRNLSAMRAAYDLGSRYMVSDSSIADQSMRTPNAALRNFVVPELLMIPRRPTNLFYNVSVPEEWVSEYNHLYRSYWGRDLTYEEILDEESNVLLLYILRGELAPWMFHQANLRFYAPEHSLLTDLLRATFDKFQNLYRLPLESPSMEVLGERAAWRLALSEVAVNAVITPGQSITLSAPKDLVLPVTGLPLSCADQYGGQPTSFIRLKAGVPVTFPLSGMDVASEACLNPGLEPCVDLGSGR
ncbi:hypothetical protein POL68_02675 [Stigmatella sp. ncwal1]|uniref:Polysaccharide deacetylase n=1 Tax=Stigmatella ashevillensis TaxID=2995309 RepID=A0ABT5D122_9BACT|nr:hypothetical protein [Stigmatella ashevillena]MDC0707365.1 hypothetical protein [Stigmatella ashevillena]